MKRVFLQKVFMECVNYFENWLVGLPHTDSIGQKKGGSRRLGIQILGGHRKVVHVKTSMRSDDFWFCELLARGCEGNQEWRRHHL